MEAIYFLGCKISALFFGFIWVACLLIQLAFNSFAWIDDRDAELLKPFKGFLGKIDCWRPDMGDFFTIFGGVGFFVVIAFTFVWPVIYPTLIAYGILYSIRHFKRFQKKIKLAFDDKADKKHKHNQDDIVLNED